MRGEWFNNNRSHHSSLSKKLDSFGLRPQNDVTDKHACHSGSVEKLIEALAEIKFFKLCRIA